MGQLMDYQSPMTAPTIPTMVWGGQIRLMARTLGVQGSTGCLFCLD